MLLHASPVDIKMSIYLSLLFLKQQTKKTNGHYFQLKKVVVQT